MENDPKSIFKTKPYKHQQTAFEQTANATYAALFLEMGLGKSKVLIDTLAHLWVADEINGAVIVAPKGVIPAWSEEQLPTHLSDLVPRGVYTWNNAKTKKEAARREALLTTQDLAILLINSEALSTTAGEKFVEQFLRTRTALMAIDESTQIKTPSARRTKAALRLGKLAPYRRILTGSPVTAGPLDVFSQVEFLQPGALGCSSFFSFRNRYAKLERKSIRRDGRLTTFQQVTGFQRLDELQERLSELSVRQTKSECLDLPEKTYQRRVVDLTPEQRKAYKDLQTHSWAQLSSTEFVTAQLALTEMLRLHQLVCGHVRSVDDNLVRLPTQRVTALLDVLEETSGKALIWSVYRDDLDRIQESLTSRYGPQSWVRYDGTTSQEDRATALRRFNEEPDCRWFLGQPRTGGYGLTLTEASTVIYYSNSFDLEARLQSEDRAHRIGQRSAVTYVDLVAQNTIDEKIVHALRNKIDLAALVTGDAWKEWLV